jgi:formylglycine-generating enzyme required for sulfatase activity
VAANSFAVAGASSVTNDLNGGVVTAVFPVTGPNLLPVSDTHTSFAGISPQILMIGVQGGTFYLGDAWGTSNPTANATVSSFRMSQYLIRRSDFLAVMGTDPSNPAAASAPASMSDPVQMINWYMAIAFCNKLSLAEGLAPVYAVAGVDFASLAFGDIPTTDTAAWNAATADWSATGYRLPTEAEYMWAQLGGQLDSRPGDVVGGINTGGWTKVYAGSTEAGAAYANVGLYEWYGTNSGGTTHPVGGKLPNELGLYDLCGNLYSFCWDANTGLPTSDVVDYRGGAPGNNRICRGGGYGSTYNGGALSHRGSGWSYSPSTCGFRIVRN